MAEMVVWAEAPEATAIAKDLIPKYHVHLEEFALRIVYRSRARNAGYQRVAGGTAEIIRGRFAYFAMTEEEIEMQREHFENPYQMFWMEIGLDVWETFSPEQQIALVDHELCHFHVEIDEEKSEPTLVIKEHDVEEFEAIVRRHGAWSGSLENFAAALMGMEGA